VMHEYISPGFRSNKPITFLVAEPLYFAFCHYSLPSFPQK
jgi:hypothetical protein